MQWADLFVAARAYDNPALDAWNTSAAPQLPKKFDIFHKRNFRKTADAFERATLAKHPMIAAAHAQQKTGVMSETIGQPVNESRAWQANSKKTSGHISILEQLANFIQTVIGHFGIYVQKPEHIAPRHFRSRIQLLRSSTLSLQHAGTKSFGQFSCPVRATAVDNDDFCTRCALPQLSKERLNQRSFVEDRNNDRNKHLRTTNPVLFFGVA